MTQEPTDEQCQKLIMAFLIGMGGTATPDELTTWTTWVTAAWQHGGKPAAIIENVLAGLMSPRLDGDNMIFALTDAGREAAFGLLGEPTIGQALQAAMDIEERLKQGGTIADAPKGRE